MDSAEGQVQHLNYTATFPLLLNVAGQPTYFMALKDASELVKLYAMVNVNQYQIVATGASVSDCEESYRQMLLEKQLIDGSAAAPAGDLLEKTGVIAELRSAVVNGNSVYFLRFVGEEDFSVRASAAQVPYAPLLSEGDRVRVTWRDGDAGQYWVEAYNVEKIN